MAPSSPQAGSQARAVARAVALLLPLSLLAADGPSPVESVLFLKGFDVQWQRRPHRLRSLGVGAEALAEHGAEPLGRLWLQAEGGRWSTGSVERTTGIGRDIADVRLRYGGVALVDRSAVVGSTDFAVAGTVPWIRAGRTPATASEWVTVPWPSGKAAGAVWLTSYLVEASEDHPDGFTVHALGVSTGPLEVDGATARFPLVALVEAAPVPDRGQSLDHYGATVHVGWAVVPSDVEGFRRLEVSAGIRNPPSLQGTGERQTPERVPLMEPGSGDVAVGLSGFRVELSEEGMVDGRYLRGLTVDLSADHVGGGTWSGEACVDVTCLGSVTRPLRATIDADWTLLRLGPKERAWAGEWSGASEPWSSPMVTTPYPVPTN